MALRLRTLRPSEHPAVFAQAFTRPTSLDPDSLCYRYAESRGVYGLAQARQKRIRLGAED